MSDLISKRALIKHFEAIQQEENVVGLVFVAAIDEIKGQPTAYDVDKVVKELEQKKTKLLSYARDYEKIGNFEQAEIYSQIASEYTTAIEIVKQGGVSDASDNVCEWKKYPFDWFTGCDGYEIYNKQGNYCPRCGRKIEVVK